MYRSPEAACEVLKVNMAKVEGLPGGKPFPRWFCDGPSAPDNQLVYIFGLRTAPDPRDLAAGDKLGYSQLVGWFAVARKSSLVFEYDINEQRLIPISQAYYKRPATPNLNRPVTPPRNAPPRSVK